MEVTLTTLLGSVILRKEKYTVSYNGIRIPLINPCDIDSPITVFRDSLSHVLSVIYHREGNECLASLSEEICMCLYTNLPLLSRYEVNDKYVLNNHIQLPTCGSELASFNFATALSSLQ